MTLRKGPSGIWEGDYRYVGFDRLHLSLRTKKRAEAEARDYAVRQLYRQAKGPGAAGARALIRQMHDGLLAVERLDTMIRTGVALVPDADVSAENWPTVDQGADRYLAWIEVNENKRHSTWHAAQAQLRKALAFTLDGARLGSLPMDRVPTAMVDAYQASLIAAGRPANTITNYMNRVGALWGWVQRRENRLATEQRRVPFVLPCPVDPETTHRSTSSRDRWLTREEAERVMAATPERLQCIVALGLFAGLRIGEALHLRPEQDIDLTLGTLAIQSQGDEWRPKTKRAVRVVPIAAPLRPLIEHHLVRFASDEWLMPSVEDPTKPFVYSGFHLHFGAIVERAELVAGRKDPRGVVFHTLRHTFASWLVMKGIDLYTVAQLLGDTLGTVEKVYAHLSPDFKKRAIAALAEAMTMPTPPKPNDAQNDTETEVTA